MGSTNNNKEPPFSIDQLLESFNFMSTGAWQWWVRQGLFEISDQLLESLGWAPCDSADNPLFFQQVLLHPFDLASFLEDSHDFAQCTTTELTVEYRLRTRSGEDRWHLLHGKVVETDDNNNPTRVIGFNQDISQTRSIEFATSEHQKHILNALDTLGDGSWQANLQEHSFSLSQQALAVLDNADLLGASHYHNLTQYLHPEDKVAFAHGFRNCIMGRSALINIELRFRIAPQNYRWFKIRGKVTATNKKGRASHMAGLLIDIDPRKQAELQLLANVTRLRLAVKATGAGIYEYNQNHNTIVYFNDAWPELSGHQYEQHEADLDHDSWLKQAIHHDDLGLVKQHQTSLLNKLSDNVHYEYRLKHAGGEYRTIQAWATRTNSADGRTLGFLCLELDVTHVRMIEASLRSSEQIFSTMFHASPEIIMLTRPSDLSLVLANEAFYRAIGDDNLSITPGSHLDFLWGQPEKRKEFVDMLRDKTRIDAFESTMTRLNGSVFPTRASSRIIKVNSEELMLTVVIDLSYEKLAEQERDELKSSLQKAQKMQALGQLTGGIAHDFNNILSSVIGYTELSIIDIDDPNNNPKVQGYLQEVYQAGKRGRSLIQQMLSFSRGGTGKAETVDIISIVRDAIRMLRPTMPATLDFHTYFDYQVPEIFIDPSQLHQIVVNLCINARDAAAGEGCIYLRVREVHYQDLICASCHGNISGQYVELSIEDTGSGIAQTALDKIFEPFFSTKKVGQGSGMGLPVVHGILHEHQGHILVDSITGDGTEFRLLFPLVTTPARAKPRDHDASQPSEILGRLLIVDDEEAVVNLIAEICSKQGYLCTKFTDSKKALAYFSQQKQQFDLVITDQTMPGFSGIELATAMLEVQAELPIILCTGYSDILENADTRSSGITGFLNKPFQSQQLLTMIAELLQPENATTEVLS